MTKEKSSDWTVPIAVAVIGLVGTCVAAFFAIPAFQTWVGSLFSPSNPKSLAVEEIPQRVFAYYGNAVNLGGVSTVNLAYDGSSPYPSYMLDYNVPAGQTGYAGMAFQFNNGQNMTRYNAVEFTIQFNEINVPIDFYVKDISNEDGYIRILSTSTDKMKLRYELGNFKQVNFNALKEVGFNSDNSFSSGRHIVTISGIRFVH